MPEQKRKARRWFPVWCQALGNMLVYHFHRFSVGAYILLVIALVIALGKIQVVANQANSVAEANRHLVIENRHRVEDIQRSRVHSCRQTYESFNQVFKPFFRPAKLQTPKEKHDLAKFKAIIKRLKSKCVTQTKPKETRP